MELIVVPLNQSVWICASIYSVQRQHCLRQKMEHINYNERDNQNERDKKNVHIHLSLVSIENDSVASVPFQWLSCIFIQPYWISSF